MPQNGKKKILNSDMDNKCKTNVTISRFLFNRVTIGKLDAPNNRLNCKRNKRKNEKERKKNKYERNTTKCE